MTAVAKGELHFPPDSKQLDEYINYPNLGDMRQVRPSIRAAEMILRAGVAKDDAPSNWPSEFWMEAWRRTNCLLVNPDEGAKGDDHRPLFDKVAEINNDVFDHFISTIDTTDVDPRHDGAFGLVCYVLHLLAFSLKGVVGQTTQGRITLRSAVEALINLTFLATKDDPTIWLQYRNYGAGQAKLSYLKFNDEDTPAFVTRDLLEEIANADMWLEFQDIKLGAWANKKIYEVWPRKQASNRSMISITTHCPATPIRTGRPLDTKRLAFALIRPINSTVSQSHPDTFSKTRCPIW